MSKKQSRKKRSALQQEYYKNRNRIKKYIREKERQYYIIPQDVLPNVPKRITKASVNRLKKLTAKEIMKKSKAIDLETGEETSVYKRQKQDRERKRQEKLKQEEREKIIAGKIDRGITFNDWSNIIISNVKSIIAEYPTMLQPLVRPWLEKMIEVYGQERVAEMLERAQNEGYEITRGMAYSTEEINKYIANLQTIMNNMLDSENLSAEQYDELRKVTPTREILGDALPDYFDWLD